MPRNGVMPLPPSEICLYISPSDLIFSCSPSRRLGTILPSSSVLPSASGPWQMAHCWRKIDDSYDLLLAMTNFCGFESKQPATKNPTNITTIDSLTRNIQQFPSIGHAVKYAIAYLA